MNIWRIVFKSLRQHALSTCVTAFSIALAGGLLMSVWVVKQQSQATFTGVNGGFDAVLGARGSKLQLVLNALWSWIFFRWHEGALALLEICALWLAVLFTLVHFLRIRRSAGLLLLPYLLWVSIATALTRNQPLIATTFGHAPAPLRRNRLASQHV